MELFVVVIAILFVQVWGAQNPFHKDAWLYNWIAYLEKRYERYQGQLAWLVLGSVFFIATVGFWLLSSFSDWLLLPVGVGVLLYSFGRGEFNAAIATYLDACKENDWELAIANAALIDGNLGDFEKDSWPSLHAKVLESSAYRGFERMFAVLFWFFVLGPLGALIYRVTFLFCQNRTKSSEGAKHFLWLMEWPAARVLGISFAFTGNFMGCYHRWRENLLCTKRPTEVIVAQSVLGALSVEEEIDQNCEVTRKELLLLDKLYMRTLWFWLATAAIVILFI